ncbi:MAG: vitamin B12 dependent-methionine synthase activation domain-containing protein [Bacillota bacterium]
MIKVDKNINLNKKEILKYLHYHSNDIDEFVKKQINISIDKIIKISNIKFNYKIYNQNIKENKLELNNTEIKFSSKKLIKHLKESKRVVIFCMTLGKSVDREIKKLTISDMSKALILDAVATEYIEKIADQLTKKIAYKNNLFESNRFSPGYGDLKLNVQNKILNILEANKKVGIYLNDENLMIPQKSITAFFGLYKNKLNNKKTCDYCIKKGDCQFRKEGEFCYEF